jgi:hypothetical protein
MAHTPITPDAQAILAAHICTHAYTGHCLPQACSQPHRDGSRIPLVQCTQTMPHQLTCTWSVQLP